MSTAAPDAVYVTYDGLEARGRAAIREAFVAQFRGDFGRIRFLSEDVVVDEGAGKVVLRWRCQHDLSRVWGLPGPVGLKQLFFRGLYGRAFGWEGLDVLRHPCPGEAAARAPRLALSRAWETPGKAFQRASDSSRAPDGPVMPGINLYSGGGYRLLSR